MLDTVCVLDVGGVVWWQRSTHETRRRALVNQLVSTVLLQDRAGAAEVVLDDCKLYWALHNEAKLIVVGVCTKFVDVPYARALLVRLAADFAEQHKAALACYRAAASCAPGSRRHDDTRSSAMARLLDDAAAFDAHYDRLLGSFGVPQRHGGEATRRDGHTDDTNDDDGGDDKRTRHDGGDETRRTATAAATADVDTTTTTTSIAATTTHEGKVLMTRQGKRVLVRRDGRGGVAAVSTAAGGSGNNNNNNNNSGGGGGDHNNDKRKRRAKLPTVSDKPARRAVVVVPSSNNNNNNDGDTSNNNNDDADGDKNVSRVSETQLSAQAERQKAALIRRLPNGSVAPVCERQWAQREAAHTRLTSWLRGCLGQREVDAQALQRILPGLREKLLAKNVAVDVAEHVCTSVETSLAGTRVATLASLQQHVEAGLTAALRRILQPSREVNLLRDVAAARARGRPYTIVFCGVNGVGKSTSLAKVAYWMTQNGLRVLLAAGDTFRHGAVEQLLVHSRCLDVPLYQMGYGADPSAVAAAAIAHATRQHHDVVMIDTAGRMQDHEPRMRALAKLIHDNAPDLVLFVGEALVGNNGIDQLRKFNRCLVDYAPAGASCRGIDGILLTKFDTIDDKVGAALSMVYELGQPIVFVGVGQAYQDLKVLDPEVVVSALMQ